jgi:DNA-binding transcriptional MerR regulator
MSIQSATVPAEPVLSESEISTPAVAGADKAPSRKSATAFRTISEVAEDLDVPQHVLRFWETKFSQVRPLKRGGGRRYYRPEDVDLIKTIHHLLYTEGYTIKGVQKLLKERGKSKVVQNNRPGTPPKAVTPPVAMKEGALSEKNRTLLESMLGELKELRRIVTAE